MARACRRKDSTFETSQVKSVFLYGKPNKVKLNLLSCMQQKFCELANENIRIICKTDGLLLQLVKNDKKDSAVRKLEKQSRPAGLNSAFCQAAFDYAFTRLSNRFNTIRKDMYAEGQTIFTQSKVLFAMSLMEQPKEEMSAVMKELANGKLHIGWAYTRSMKQPKTSVVRGVDTGITDVFHTSDGKAIGSMKPVLDFYHNTVEPSFAGLSDLRNKKRSVTGYMDGLKRDTFTVIERLDIKEFKKSRKVNGMFSCFARGKTQEALMKALNWKGYDFVEVAPEFTSQVCPVCGNLDSANRDGKRFKCICCGHEDDADHVGSINIRERAVNKDLMDICEKHRYGNGLQNALKDYYMEQNEIFKKQHPQGMVS